MLTGHGQEVGQSPPFRWCRGDVRAVQTIPRSLGPGPAESSNGASWTLASRDAMSTLRPLRIWYTSRSWGVFETAARIARWSARGDHSNQKLTRKTSGRAYAFLHRAVDDHSRVAYSEVLGGERKETAAAFWVRGQDAPRGRGNPRQARVD